MADNDARSRHDKVGGTIRRAKRSLDFFEARRDRALERLKNEDIVRPRGECLYIGITDIQLERDEIVVLGGAKPNTIIRRVEEPPGEVELAQALRKEDTWRFGYLAAYARTITHELITPIWDDQPQGALNLAWAITSLMRIRSRGQFIAPAYCNVPWSTVAAIEDHSVAIGLLDEYPKAIRFDDPPAFASDDFAWVSDQLDNWFGVWEIESFRLAAESYWSYYHHPNPRMMVANLWSGIEALFNHRMELRFRLALSIASLVEPRGPTRIALYKKIVKLYDGRSVIVHGQSMSDAKIHEHISEASGILARLLEACINRGTVWSEEEVTASLMS